MRPLLLTLCLLISSQAYATGDAVAGRAYLLEQVNSHGVAWVIGKSKYFAFLPTKAKDNLLAAVRDKETAIEMLAYARAAGIVEDDIPENARWLLEECRVAAGIK